MTCAELEDRLFDEDCRAALLGRAAVPLDVAEHTARCPACARQWAEAAGDTQQLSERLVVAPPPAMVRRLYRAFRPKARSWVLRFDTDVVSWAVAGGAVGAGLAGAALAPYGPPDWAGFLVGASVGLTVVAFRAARPSALATVGLLRSVASRCLAGIVLLIEA